MSVAVLVSSAGVLPIKAAAADSTDYSINWDYDYGTTPQNALKSLAEQQISITDYTGDVSNVLKEHYNELRWTHVKSWNTNSNDYKPVSISADWKDKYTIENPLRDALADPDVKYVALYDDDTHQVHARGDWEPMQIKTDKVLDLNGHTLEIRFDRNVNNSYTNRYQKDTAETLNCTAFEISNGATLTIIDSSEWRGEGDGGHGSGKIYFSAYAVDPFTYDIHHYTTRDLFRVNDGNLVIYGGTFQAGRAKTHVKSSFSMEKLKTVVGSVVSLGVSVAEYATGINSAIGAYSDVNAMLQKAINQEAKEQQDTGEDDGKDGTPGITKRDGTNNTEVNVAGAEPQKDTPAKKESRDQTVSEKKNAQNDKVANGDKPGNQEAENKANGGKDAKNDLHSKLAEDENNIVKASTDKDKIGDIVDGCFTLVDQFTDLLGLKKGKKAMVTQSILGTVVRVGTAGTFVAYGGTFKGYGSTPNTRNAVVEITIDPSTRLTWDKNKYTGGLAYIYGGTFEAYTGANVFNFVHATDSDQIAAQAVRDQYGNVTTQTVTLNAEETNGLEIYFYENQSKIGQAGVTPIPINTGNVQVRGGLFRCFYDALNLAVKEEGDTDHFRVVPGTMGSVNLGVNSFNSQLIKDGRIQIDDIYGDGALVLLDDRADEDEPEDGLYHYRLYCGDTELRYKSYYQVYPNNGAAVSASRSMQLTSFENNQKTSNIFSSDGTDNIRAPYRETEYYFDYVVDNAAAKNYSVKPNFFNPATSSMTDWTGMNLSGSEVWYYPTPMSARVDSSKQPIPVPDVALGNELLNCFGLNAAQRMLPDDDLWYEFASENNLNSAYRKTSDSIRTNMKYFTYKCYRVDPLTRDNLNETGTTTGDDPLFTVRYGVNDDCLKCILRLSELEERIGKAKGYASGQWHFSAGEMYRITLDVEEYVGIGCGFTSDDKVYKNEFAAQLPAAKTRSSVLIRCCSQTDSTQDLNNDFVKEKTFSPLRLSNVTLSTEQDDYGYDQNIYTVKAGSTAVAELKNAKAGMVDYSADGKIFDLYYQWIEVDKNGNPIRTSTDSSGKKSDSPSIFAGTDNIYDAAMAKTVSPSDFLPQNFMVGSDGKVYLNTPDPDDPATASYRDRANGLPSNKADWTPEMLHTYTFAWYGRDGLERHTGNLSIDNNNYFVTNTDRCYIPESMAGKYFRVKAIAVNLTWNNIFDERQTFWSPVVKVESPDAQYFRSAISANSTAYLRQIPSTKPMIRCPAISIWNTTATTQRHKAAKRSGTTNLTCTIKHRILRASISLPLTTERRGA